MTHYDKLEGTRIYRSLDSASTRTHYNTYVCELDCIATTSKHHWIQTDSSNQRTVMSAVRLAHVCSGAVARPNRVTIYNTMHYTLSSKVHDLTVKTHTRLTALCPVLPGWAGTRKVKSIWILLKQVTVSGSGISWAICKAAPRSRQMTTPAPPPTECYTLVKNHKSFSQTSTPVH